MFAFEVDFKMQQLFVRSKYPEQDYCMQSEADHVPIHFQTENVRLWVLLRKLCEFVL